MAAGKLIVFEGIDGSGKETQARLLKPDFYLAFPRYDKLFGKIIKFLLHLPWGQKINPYLMAWLFATDRFLAKPEINFRLRLNQLVVIDRYTASSQAHQGAKLKGKSRESIIKWIDWLENKVYCLPQPDKVFFLNLPPQKAKELIIKRGREQDAAEKDFVYQQETYLIYQDLAKKKKWVIINSLDKQGKLLPVREIHECIRSRIVK